MPIELKMPALSPTMEEGTLAKWLVKEGDKVASGDILAEIETDKATMEFEAVDEGTIAKILVAEGTDGVKVGAVDRDHGRAKARTFRCARAKADSPEPAPAPKAEAPKKEPEVAKAAPPAPGGGRNAARSRRRRTGKADSGDRVKASPLARRLAEAQGIDLSQPQRQRPGRADRQRRPRRRAAGGSRRRQPARGAQRRLPRSPVEPGDIPHEVVKLSNMRKTIARRLTESKQQVPHIYLTVDIQLDALLKLRGELNAGLESRGVKLSVNDLLIKALAVALIEVPECNVSFARRQR